MKLDQEYKKSLQNKIDEICNNLPSDNKDDNIKPLSIDELNEFIKESRRIYRMSH